MTDLNVKEITHRRRALMVMAFSSAISTVAFAGPVITYDGQQYLASAKGLLAGEFGSNYFLARPPGYPSFLAVSHLISGGNFRFLVLLQALVCAGSTAYLLLGVFQKFSVQRKIFYLISALALFQINVMGYSSAILQQSLFVAYTNLLTGYVLRHYRDLNWRRHIILALLVLSGALISPTMNAISYILLLVLICIKVFCWNKEFGHKFRQLMVAILGLASIALPSILFGVMWGDFTASMSRISPAYNVANSPGVRDLIRVPSYFLENPQKAFDQLAAAYVSQSGLVPSSGWSGTVTVVGSPLYENRIQAEQNYLRERNCGLIDNVNNAPWVLYNQGFIPPDCAPLKLPRAMFTFLTMIASIGKLLWISSIVLIVLCATILWQRRSRNNAEFFCILSIPSVLTSYTYVLLGAQADRYAIQAQIPFLLTVILIFFVVNKPTIRDMKDRKRLQNA